MTKIFCFIAIVLLFACNPSSTKGDKKKDIKTTTSHPPSSLETFADSLVRLDKYARQSIGQSAAYFHDLVPADSTLADSAAVMVLQFIWHVTDSVNSKLWQDTTDYMDLVYEGGNPPTAAQKAFQQGMAKDHLKIIGNGEGDVMAILDYDWIKPILQSKTSAAVDTYLALLAKEESEPALLDAGLAIELDELIRRLISSEELISKRLPQTFAQNVINRNKFYTDILLVGSDNSPSLEDETKLTLVPEFKKAYNALLQNYPASKAAERVREWLAILKAKDRKKVEAMQQAAYQ
jgi:hypothetical protein